MTKLELWNEVKSVIVAEVAKTKQAEVIAKLEPLLAPKKSGGTTRPQPIQIDGITHYYCRYTDAYWATEEMIYQNEEKREALQDKGYSKLGISLWNRGRKYLDNLQKQVGDALMANDLEKAKELNEELTNLKKQGLTNNSQWLLENVATEEEQEIIKNHKT